MEDFNDDDFGELYATDVEVPNTFPKEEEEEEEEEANANSNGVNLDQEKNNDSVNDNCVASDSDDDDDLNIVLNDEDIPAGVVGCDEDGDGDEGDDHGSELVSKNGIRGGHGSRFFHHKAKYTRSRGSMFVNNMNANTSMGMASYCPSLNKGSQNGDMCAAANPMVVQCGYGSFLPWYWSIFNVNIDTLKEKPWKVPGVEKTDYFNFGFNESTWKLYCASLEQLWQTSLQTGISVDESAKLNQEAMREHIDQVVSGSVIYPSSDGKLPKGRAIQVEDSMFERQPSIDVRRPRSRDSDVIIQIKVLESSDDCSGSGNSIVMDTSLEGESILGNNRNMFNSSSEREDVLSEDQLEDVKNSEDSSIQERSGLIPGVDEDEHQNQADQHSEDTAEIPGGEIKAEEGGGIDTCNSDPCWIESELSLGDQEHSLTSYRDSDSEASENSVQVDDEKSLSPLRRKSMNSVTDLKECLPLYCKSSKNKSLNRQAVNIPYYSRTRGPFEKEWRHQGVRHEPGSNLNEHIENKNDVSSILMSSYDRHKGQLQGFVSHKRRDVSYNREAKRSCYYSGEKVVNDPVQTVHSKYSYREDQESFRENINRYDRKNGDVRDHFFKPSSRMEDSEDRERDWYRAGCRYSSDDPSPHSYGESRLFLQKHSSFPGKERDTQRRIMNGKSHFRDRNCNNDFYDCEFEFQNKSYIMSTSAADREMESFDNEHEEQFPHIDRDWRSVRRVRPCDRSSLVLDNLWYGKMGDKCQKYTHHQTSNYRYHRQSYIDSGRNYVFSARVSETFGDRGRYKHAKDNGGCDWSCGYTDTTEDEDLTIYPVEEYQFNRSPSEFLNWAEDDIIRRHHETRAASLCMPRRGTENCIKGSSKITCTSKHGQAVLRCRKSVDLVNGEGKFHARKSGVLCNGRLEYIDQGISKKQRAFVGFDESHKKAIKFDTSKYESNHENKKWLQNLPDKGQKEESSDIEEGQIVTEEPYIEASVSRRDVSEGAALTDGVKKRISQKENNCDQFIGGYDNQRIIDSIAKMEKRRERFKQPITMKKEAEESLKLNNDSIIDTGEIKQHRPARKRRWVGN
ncbi:FIP1[V]-like protein [Gastrolobium bilobum]|uniref:FIP1[V]-like protein n=1 Tax=Gastrolobium bilobum TaxID=150636 RepID=UPI002AAFD5B5|nr:FIP1[V]-like protein [Gastrolobium bilobum]